MRRFQFAATLLAGAIGFSAKASPVADRPLVVHEWGTFTCLQDERGDAIPGINTDDEPVPTFVHDISGDLAPRLTDLPPVMFKAVPRCHPDVTMRLETPVVYFYPPESTTQMKVDLSVSFRGGWLTQYYPSAAPSGRDVEKNGRLYFGRIGADSDSSLTWNKLRIGGMETGPQTNDRVWLAPREVKAASVMTTDGEKERYVFYRGVGHMNAPLRVVRDGETLHIRYDDAKVSNRPGQAIHGLWLVDVRADGTLAFRAIDPNDRTSADDADLAATPATFKQADYSPDGLARVRGKLHAALTTDGLFPDEATAMLNTWEVSYFKRPGLRLFFMTPRPWTESKLPMHLSQSADITRVMVGRIEIVTPRQRELLGRIAAGPASTAAWVNDAARRLNAKPVDSYREDWYRQNGGGGSQLAAQGFNVPPDYANYLSLGRFRNALVNEELRRNPSQGLAQFIQNYNLELHSFN